MRRFSLSPFVAALALALVAGLAACSDEGPDSDPSRPDDDPPTPYDGDDEILYRVFVENEPGTETLRWVGDPSGPDDASPETTDTPFVPFGKPFRIEWDVDAAGAPVVGTRFRVYKSAGESFFLPDAGLDSVAYDETRSFRFANETPERAIDPLTCGTGPNCYGDLRLDSGRFYFEVQSINMNGRVVDTLQTLAVDVNYAPRAGIGTLPPVPDSTAAFPAWTFALNDGGMLERPIASGDTIPSGATVRVLARGRDRLDGVADPESLCCDLRLDDEVPEVRFQARTRFTFTEQEGELSTLDTLYGVVDADSVLRVNVGPARYELEIRSVDEHGRRSEAETFTFVGGHPPRTPRMTPDAGDAIVLYPPDVEPPLVDGEPAYELVSQTRFFVEEFQEWVYVNGGSDVQQTGHAYRIPVRLESDADPRSAGVDRVLGDFTDLPRAFAYELVSEFDPGNRIEQGVGDRIDYFVDVDTPGVLALDGIQGSTFEGIEVFVPDAFWAGPALYDSTLAEAGGPDPIPLLNEIGTRVRKEVGAYTFRAQARTTARGATFTQLPPLPADVDGELYEFPVSSFDRFGLHSPIAAHGFSIRLEIELDGQPTLWPAESP